jgi:nitrite reductase/ring-hydroxylating ferredoxin subunit
MPDQQVLSPFAGSMVPHLGTYRRVLPVNLERMFENALDWEHLPYVHASSFQAIECLSAGAWGWRAEVVDLQGDRSTIELRLDRLCRRWITRTLVGRNQGFEIWTHAFPIDAERVDIVVDFFAPGVADPDREKLGKAFATLYQRLYDEDVAMMVERQRQLDRRIESSKVAEQEVILGPRESLELPQRCEVGGRSYVVAELDGTLIVYPALCPHQFGPLAVADIDEGTVTCPWHGYTFDLRSGECLTGQTCRLMGRTRISERDGEIVVGVAQ